LCLFCAQGLSWTFGGPGRKSKFNKKEREGGGGGGGGGARGGAVDTLRYKPEGCGFDSR